MVTQEKDFRCLNPECSLGALQMFNTGGQVTLEGPELEFRMPITISDHTGTVSGRLTANILETMTGMKVSLFRLRYCCCSFLIHSQPTNFGLFQTQRVCRRQFQL